MARQDRISCNIELMGTSVALTFSEQKLVYILPRYFCSVIRRLATEEFYIAFCDDTR